MCARWVAPGGAGRIESALRTAAERDNQVRDQTSEADDYRLTDEPFHGYDINARRC